MKQIITVSIIAIMFALPAYAGNSSDQDYTVNHSVAPTIDVDAEEPAPTPETESHSSSGGGTSIRHLQLRLIELLQVYISLLEAK